MEHGADGHVGQREPFAVPNTAFSLKDINEGHSPRMAEYLLRLLWKQSDFDSPMRRFDPSRPSQAVGALVEAALPAEKGPRFGGLS